MGELVLQMPKELQASPVTNPETRLGKRRRPPVKALMHLNIPVKRHKVTPESSGTIDYKYLKFELNFPQVDKLPLSERLQHVLDFDCGGRDSSSDPDAMAQSGQIRHAILGEVTMRPTDFADTLPEAEENAEKNGAKVELIENPIMDPGLIDIEKQPTVRTIRTAWDDDKLKRAILDLFGECRRGEGLKIDRVADDLKQPRDAVKR